MNNNFERQECDCLSVLANIFHKILTRQGFSLLIGTCSGSGILFDLSVPSTSATEEILI